MRLNKQVLDLLNKENSSEVLKGLLLDLCILDKRNGERLLDLYYKR